MTHFFFPPRRTVLLPGLFCAFFAITAGAQADTAQASGADLSRFVQSNITNSINTLNNPQISGTERQRRLRDSFLNFTDLRRMALFTLGDFAAKAPPSDVEAFVAAFKNYAIASYGEQLAKLHKADMKVTAVETRSDRESIVSGYATGDGGTGSANLGFRISRNDAGKPVVTDIRVSGIWMSVVTRAEFGPYLYLHGGDVGALTSRLNKTVEDINTAS